MAHATREAWLTAGIELLRPHFEAAGYTVPENVKVTCGWPSKSALSVKRQAIGECWSDDASAGKVFEMFISPTLAEPVGVLATLTHELVHATVGLAAKHRGPFKRCAIAVGLEGKMRSTHAGDKLRAVLDGYATELGEYPHKELRNMTNGQRKQGARLVKAECECCAYTVRVTRKWLDMAGAPLCPMDGCDKHGQPLTVVEG